MINDLDTSFAMDLQRSINLKLKGWAGIGRSVDNGLLFRSKRNFGLGLTPLSHHYQRMQLIKCELLRTSKDPSIVELYKQRESCNAKLTRTWKATKALAVVNAEVDLNLKFPSQENNQGLGFGKFNPNPNCSERRKLISVKNASLFEETLIAHSTSLKQQSVWLQWKDTAEPFDFSWENIIWGGISAEVFKFVLNASVNWVRTPDLLNLWNYKKSCFCILCGAQKCTLHHILSECSYSLNDKRFTWRHDSVLSLIWQALCPHIEHTNSLQPKAPRSMSIPFVKAGAAPTKTSSKKDAFLHMLSNANDWKMLVDLPGSNFVFPPEIYSTAERPDILIWSEHLQEVILVELTCPAEEGIQAAQMRKEGRYMTLLDNISRSTSWKPKLLTVEVGVRGFVANNTRLAFNKLGLQRKDVSELCRKLSSTSARCSYTIYLAADSKVWDRSRPLLDQS
jgi:hypothetical protein